MLKGIPRILSPRLLQILASMGHGDEIVLADANFPGERLNANVVRCDGLEIVDLLEAILQLFPLDTAVDTPWVMMQPSDLKNYDDRVEKIYEEIMNKYSSGINGAEKMERFNFYNRASASFAIVMTGTLKRFGNVIIKKGTIFN